MYDLPVLTNTPAVSGRLVLLLFIVMVLAPVKTGNSPDYCAKDGSLDSTGCTSGSDQRAGSGLMVEYALIVYSSLENSRAQ